MAKPSSLIRWSGPASILGAVLLVVHIALSFTLGPEQGTSNPYEIYNPFLYVAYNLPFDAALLLFAVGLVGLYARGAERSGWLGRTGLFLALSEGALAAVSIVATLMVGLLPGLWPVILLDFFTWLLAILCLVAGLGILGIAAMRAPASQGQSPKVPWRWALLILGIGLGAALLSEALEFVMGTNIPVLNIKGTHLLHVLVTVFVAAWVARKAGTAPILYGVLVGLVSGIINQLYFHVLPGMLAWNEVIIILILSVGAGWLGGVIAQATLAEQETLYRASRAIGEASGLQNIVDAVGEHLADPQVSHVALWQDISEAEDGAPTELSLLAVWMPWVARVWGPGVWRPGLRLDAAQLPTLASLRQQSPLVLRVRKLPASERAVWEHQGIRSAVLLPLVTSGGEQIGLLMIASRRTYGFSRVKVRTYLTIGAQVELVLENLRLLEQA